MPESQGISDWFATGLLFIAQLLLAFITVWVAALTGLATAPCGRSVPCGGDGWVTAAVWTAIGGGVALLAGGLLLAALRIRSGRHGWPMVLTTVGLQILLLFIAYNIGVQSGPI